METGHPSTRAVNPGSGNRALSSRETLLSWCRLLDGQAAGNWVTLYTGMNDGTDCGTDLERHSSPAQPTCTRYSSHESTAQMTWRCRGSWSTCPAPRCCPMPAPAAMYMDCPFGFLCPAPTSTHTAVYEPGSSGLSLHTSSLTPSHLTLSSYRRKDGSKGRGME